MTKRESPEAKQTICMFDELATATAAAAGKERRRNEPKLRGRHQTSIVPRERISQHAKWLEVPQSGPAHLQLNGEGLSLSSSAPQETDAVLLEAVRYQDELHLLLFAAPSQPVRINGTRVGPAAVARVQDVIEFSGHPLHVSLLNSPYVGPPGTEQLGQECPYCRSPINDEPGMRIYLCPNCQWPTHCQDDDVPEERRLECAQLASQCRSCQSKVMLEEGFLYVPDIFV